MKTRFLPILLAVLALVAASVACSFGGELSLSNVRTARDQDGNQATTVFGPNDVIYAVADLANASQGTVVKTRWFVIDVEGADPNTLIDEGEYTVNDDFFTGAVYFSLSPATSWPPGSYAVEMYLNGQLIQTVNYTVQ